MAVSDLAVPGCPQSLDAYCATARCDSFRDLSTVMQSVYWCNDDGGIKPFSSVFIQHCAGGQTVISVNDVDRGLDWVYANGALVAVFGYAEQTPGLRCIGGPSTFAFPTGCDAGTLVCD